MSANTPPSTSSATKKRSFDVAFKLEVVQYVEREGVTHTEAARKFGIDSKQVREWRKIKSDLEHLQSTPCARSKSIRKNRPGQGSKGRRKLQNEPETTSRTVKKAGRSEKNSVENSNENEDLDFFLPEVVVKTEANESSEYEDAEDPDYYDSDGDAGSVGSAGSRDLEDLEEIKDEKVDYDSDASSGEWANPSDQNDESLPTFKPNDRSSPREVGPVGRTRRSANIAREKCDAVNEEGTETVNTKRTRVRTTKGSTPKKRGRPRDPPRLDGREESTSEEDDTVPKQTYQKGVGYPMEFKLKVLKYAETHSNSATAAKFSIKAERVRDWKKARDQIAENYKGSLVRRPRPDGITIAEKLQAIAYANEHSVDEARRLYNVDKDTIRKWKAKKAELEAKLAQGEGDRMALKGPGRKPKFSAIEEDLKNWIVAVRLKGVTLNNRMILNKATALMRQNETVKDVPVPTSMTWVDKFLKRHNLKGLLGNIYGHEDPQEVLNAQFKTSDFSSKTFENESFMEIPLNPNKRFKKSISLEDKVKIIRRIEQGEGQGPLAKALRMATSTVQTIWTSRDAILHKYHNPKSKSRRDALVWKEYKPVGIVLKEWCDECLQKGEPINGTSLLAKATQLAETYKLSATFTLEAKQWLKVFCAKNNYPGILAELRGSSTTGNSTAVVKPPPTYPPYGEDPPEDYAARQSFEDYTESLLSGQTDHDSQSQDTAMPGGSQQDARSQRWGETHYPSQSQNNPANFPYQRSQPDSPSDQPSAVTNSDAIKYIGYLRTWISSNCASSADDGMLNAYLSMIENAVVKKRMAEFQTFPSAPRP